MQAEYADQLLDLVAQGSPVVAGLARQRLEALAAAAPGRRESGPDAAHRLWLSRAIEAGLERFDRGETPSLTGTEIPPGSPIGADSCWHCDSGALLGLE